MSRPNASSFVANILLTAADLPSLAAAVADDQKIDDDNLGWFYALQRDIYGIVDREQLAFPLDSTRLMYIEFRLRELADADPIHEATFARVRGQRAVQTQEFIDLLLAAQKEKRDRRR